MNRREFTKAIRVQIIKRATGANGQQYCEECGCLAKRFQIDHTDADALQTDKGRKLTADEGRLLCEPCHLEKTKVDVKVIAQAVRREARHIGAHRPKAKIKSAGFPKKERQPKIDFTQRRAMFT